MISVNESSEWDNTGYELFFRAGLAEPRKKAGL